MNTFSKRLIILGIFSLLFSLTGCGGGGGKKGGGEITPPCYNYFAFVPNRDSKTISIYSLNSGDGALTETANSPYSILDSGSSQPNKIVAHPSKNILYILCGDKTVRTCSINPNTGELTQIDSDLMSGFCFEAVITPNGNYLYACENNFSAKNLFCFNVAQDGSISEFTIGSPFILPNAAKVMKTDSTGTILYLVCNTTSYSIGEISSYSIGTNGTLTHVATNDMDLNSPNSIAISDSNQYIYISSGSDSSISQFKDGSSLTSNGTSSGGGYSRSILFTNGYLYQTNHGDDRITCFKKENDGTLSNLGDISTGDGPSYLAASPTLNHIYVLNQADESVWGYSVNSDGSLTKLTSEPKTGDNPQMILATKVQIN